MVKQYSKQDVESLAETVINNWEDGNSQSCNCCNYCFGHKGSSDPAIVVEDYPHALDCPVLIAQDILTGS